VSEGSHSARRDRAFSLLATARHDDTTAVRLQEEVRTLVPTVIRAAEETGRTLSLQREPELAGLRAEQEQVLAALGHATATRGTRSRER
jgi:hypothetical protein